MKQETIQVAEANEAKCTGIHELLDWQVVRYRKAVDEHRRGLSKSEGRCVSWVEAERDFAMHGFNEQADQWRVEYCGLICPERKNCLLAAQFLNMKHELPVYRYG